MFCEHCGAVVAEGEGFCGNCGSTTAIQARPSEVGGGQADAHPPALPRHIWPESALAILLLGAAGLFYGHHSRLPYSEPPATVRELMGAIQAADLPAFRRACLPNYYDSFIRDFGTRKYDRVSQVYVQMWQLGLPRWNERRTRAARAAAEKYESLRPWVESLGREAVRALPPDERMNLMDDRDNFNRFIYKEGLEALPQEERNRIVDVEAFRQQQDRLAFIDAYAWEFSAPEDKASLGSREALVKGSPATFAFVDRMAISQLRASDAAEIRGIARDELNQREAFIIKYGEFFAVEFLSRARALTGATMDSCTFAKQIRGGSLLRGPEAECVLRIPGDQSARMSIVFWKVGYDWLVKSIEVPGNDPW